MPARHAPPTAAPAPTPAPDEDDLRPVADVLNLLGGPAAARPASKGGRTRDAILTAAVALACRTGLDGLTVGSLATETGMSKSGLIAHFGTKEALQVAVLDAAAREFAAEVVVPALAAPRGEPRIWTLVDGWLRCGVLRRPGGCVFVKSSTELDERPGPVRDRLRAQHAELSAAIARMVAGGQREGHLRADVDADRFAGDLYAVMLGFYHRHRLLADPRAQEHARAAVAALLDAARPATGPITRPTRPPTEIP